MTTSSPPSGRRVRTALVVVLAVLVVAAATVHALWPREPRTEVERVMRAHTAFLDAYLDGRYDELWDLSSGSLHEGLRHQLVRFGEPDVPAGRVREIVERGLSRYAERYPEARRREVEVLRSAPVARVEIGRHVSVVIYGRRDWSDVLDVPRASEGSSRVELEFHYVRERGGWKFTGGSHWPVMRFKTLEGKLEASLPRTHWGDAGLCPDALVTVGPEGISEEGARLLAARLEDVLVEHARARILLDVAPTVTWESTIRAWDAIHGLQTCEIALLEATVAGPGPGVRVNGIPVSAPWDAAAARIDPRAVERLMAVADVKHRPSEFHLDSPNPVTPEGLPWILEISFTNRGAVPVRAHPMGDGDPTWRIRLLSTEPAPPPPRERISGADPEGATIIGKTIVDELDDLQEDRPPVGVDRQRIFDRLVPPLGPRRVVTTYGAGTEETPGPDRTTVLPGERITRIVTIPARPGDWFARAEVLDAHGTWRTTEMIRLGTDSPATGDGTAEELVVRAIGHIVEPATTWAFAAELVERGEAVLRLSTGDRTLDSLRTVVASDAEPTLRLLAALLARRVDRASGRKLLRSLAGRDAADPALAEVARRLLAE